MVVFRRFALPLALAGVAGCQVVFGDFETTNVGSDPPSLGSGGRVASGAGGGSPQNPCEMEGLRRCEGQALQACINGQWAAERECSTPDHCDAALGRCRVCLDQESRCLGDKTQQHCDPETGDWGTEQACESGWSCDSERGECLRCQPLEGVCIGPAMLCRCAADRLHWEPVTCATTCEQNGLLDYCADEDGEPSGSLDLCKNI